PHASAVWGAGRYPSRASPTPSLPASAAGLGHHDAYRLDASSSRISGRSPARKDVDSNLVAGDFDDGVSERLGCLLRHVVTDPVEELMRILPGELAPIGRAACILAVEIARDRDRRLSDDGARVELVLEAVVLRLA